MDDSTQNSGEDTRDVNAQTEQAPMSDANNAPSDPEAPDTSQPKRLKKTKRLIIIAALVLLFGGSAAAYFGVVVPNRPENIWKASLSNTSKSYDQLVTYLEKNKDNKGIKAKGTVKSSGGMAADGNIEAEFYDKTGNFQVDFGFAGSRYGITGRSIVPEGGGTPDIYLKFDGLKGLGALSAGLLGAEAGSLAESLESQWIVIDHTLFDQFVNTEQSSLTADDMLAIARTAGEVNDRYLFSTDEETRVLTVLEEVGKETKDDREVYHFVVGVDKENLKEYMRTLKDELKNTELKRVLESSGRSYDEAFSVEEAIKEIDEMDEDFRADVWVDLNTRLIRVIRFTDQDNREDYMELKMPYNGGSEWPFGIFINMSAEQNMQTEINYVIDTDTNIAKLTFDTNFDLDGQAQASNGRGQTINGDFTFEPHNEPVEVTKPVEALSLNEVISILFSGLTQGQPSSASQGQSGGLEL